MTGHKAEALTLIANAHRQTDLLPDTFERAVMRLALDRALEAVELIEETKRPRRVKKLIVQATGHYTVT